MTTECYCNLIRATSRKMSSRYDAALAPFGINIAQFSLLRSVRNAGPISLTDLAERKALDRSTMGRNVKVLERMGLVTTQTGKDQREAVVVLSDQGHTVLCEATPLWEDVQVQVETRLGPDASDQLRNLLKAL